MAQSSFDVNEKENNNEIERPETTQSTLSVDNLVKKSKDLVLSFLALIITIIAIGAVFIISSIEGISEVKAKNRVSVKLLELWREKHDLTTGFPKEKEELIIYDNVEYYFIIDEYNVDTKEIIKWHFAYDAQFNYVFQDAKYYILTIIAIIVAIFVAILNYINRKEKEKNKEDGSFRKSLIYYQKQKKKIENISQYVPNYCNYKNNQAYEIAKRNIIEDAGIKYNDFIAGKIDVEKLENWQKDKLKQIRKIKINRLNANDLLQTENKNSASKGTISFLPMGEVEDQKRFIIKTVVVKTLSLSLSGLVIALGFKLGGWGLGITHSVMILFSAGNANLRAIEFVNNTLKNRNIAKGDYLQEMFNLKNMFIKKEEDKKEEDKAVVIRSDNPFLKSIENELQPI